MQSYRTLDDDGSSVLPSALTSGKVYEAWVVCEVLSKLQNEEGYQATLRRSTKFAPKSAPGPINRDYPFFELLKTGREPLELWTDIEFLAMSHDYRGGALPLTRGDRHELDLVVVRAGVTGSPKHAQVLIGVECKSTGYSKDLLRSILGVRRELSLLARNTETDFSHWSKANVPADPPHPVYLCAQAIQPSSISLLRGQHTALTSFTSASRSLPTGERLIGSEPAWHLRRECVRPTEQQRGVRTL